MASQEFIHARLYAVFTVFCFLLFWLFTGKEAWSATNQPPTASALTTTTKEDTKKVLTLSGRDPEKSKLTYILSNQPSHGSINLKGNKATYTPETDYFTPAGTPDSFTFKVNDGLVDSAPATVYIHVTAVNDKPIAQNSSVSSTKNTTLDITLSGSDVDLDPLTYNPAKKSKKGGTLALQGNNVVTYTPKKGYVGIDSFTFTVKDSKNALSKAATVSITVAEGKPNQAPTANAGDDVEVTEGTGVSLVGTAADTDSNTLTYFWEQAATTPKVELLGADTLTPTFTAPPVSEDTLLTFTLTVNDGHGGIASDTVTVKVKNNSLPPATGKATAARFLECSTFGPTEAEIAAVQSLGIQGWLDQQFSKAESTVADGLDNGQVRARVFSNMANGSDQLRQRMMFAPSQIIVVSSNKNTNGFEMIPWVRLLSKHAFGNFRTLLHEVTLSPSMGKYLDFANSQKASTTTAPNENYPRELLQLFSIGLWELNQDGSIKKDGNGQAIPTYDQNTLREFARALTGWTYPTEAGKTPRTTNWEYFVGAMEPRTESHDSGIKTLLNGTVLPAGQSVEQDLEAVIDNIFQHPNVPPFIATRLIRSLVTSNPSPAYIRRVADVFVDNGQGMRGDLKAVLVAVLTDPEALAEPIAVHGHLKDPVLHILNLGRALEAQVTDPNMFLYDFFRLNELVLSPTTVFSFYSPLNALPGNVGLYGPEFQIYTPSQAIERANVIYRVLSGQYGSAFKVDIAPFIALAGEPATLVEKVNQTLLQGRMSDALRQLILEATNAIDAYDTKQRALGAIYLVAISGEYAVQH